LKEVQRIIVECYQDNNYEVEFSNSDGETLALCTLFARQFVVVWSAKTTTWLTILARVSAILNNLDNPQEIVYLPKVDSPWTISLLKKFLIRIS
jgi:hypothetical protein